ncbi:MAG: hypothetical protein IH948_04925 [Bacteroidetes bacterium]|nr:hypothetical protein [Bacteroidota bacterium]
MKTVVVLLTIPFALFISSCDRPACQNKNPIFDSYGIESFEYKDELIKEMNRIGNDKLRFWLSSYYEKDGKEYIVVHVQGADLCAKGEIQVINWQKIEGIRAAKGKSYFGAELNRLTFAVLKTDKSIDFIYTDIDRIFD